MRSLQERRDLAFTLKDTKTIVGKLRMILGVTLHLLFILLYLVVFQVRTFSIQRLPVFQRLTESSHA